MEVVDRSLGRDVRGKQFQKLVSVQPEKRSQIRALIHGSALGGSFREPPRAVSHFGTSADQELSKKFHIRVKEDLHRRDWNIPLFLDGDGEVEIPNRIQAQSMKILITGDLCGLPFDQGGHAVLKPRHQLGQRRDRPVFIHDEGIQRPVSCEMEGP
jgi:hypothetical protein